MRATPLALLLAALALAPTSCSRRGEGDDPNGPNGPGDAGPNLTSKLVLTPADVVLDTDKDNPVSIGYRVSREGEDITGLATLTLDDGRLGTFKGAQFVASPSGAGKTTVRARLGEDTGETSLTLRAKAIVIAPGAPADAPGRFNGPADPGAAPELVYPPAGALIPPNLNDLEVQFRPRSATLFELAFVGDALNLRIYTTCKSVSGGCAFTPDEDTWKLLSNGSRGGTVTVTLRGVSANGGVGSSAAQKLSFGNDDILGGLYYWAASAGGINRYDFGRRGQKAEVYYAPLINAGAVTCVGCHALSRNGKRIAVGLNIPGPARLRALDVASRSKLFEFGGLDPMNPMGFGGGSDFQAFTPDGERLVTVEKGGLTVRNAADGTVLSMTPAVANANMPDVAPDAKSVVFARSPSGCILGLFCPTLAVTNASLFTVPFTGNGFGDPKALITAAMGETNHYPSFSPDGRYVVFNRSPIETVPDPQDPMKTTQTSSYDNPKARVMIVPAAGGAPIDLASVNGSVGNSWPKWAPFVQRFGGSTIMWLTFSSRRDYGLRSPGKSQLWMVPIDPAKLAAGKDPGYPPIWLPFQDINTGNHIAQWVEKVNRAPCTQLDSTGCQSNEICVDGYCVPGVN